MNSQQFEFLQSIRDEAVKVNQYQIKYWQSFSNFSTWQFWPLVLMLILPLIVLFVTIDRRNILLLGFFGLNYHVWFSYTNKIGLGLGLWEYPYHLLPSLPSFSLDAALVPICFMLLYQWTLHRRKNIYLYALFLSAVFAFILKPIMVTLHFFHMFHGVNYFHLFLFYMLFFVISKFITNFFIWLQKRSENPMT